MSSAATTSPTFNLRCVVDNALASTAFLMRDIPSNSDIDDFKEEIWTKKKGFFKNVEDSSQLKLWRVTIPTGKGVADMHINVGDSEDEELLMGGATLSDYFPEGAPLNIIHIIVEPPKALDGLIVGTFSCGAYFISTRSFKPEKKPAFTWSMDITTVTLADLNRRLLEDYLDLDHPPKSTPEIFAHTGQPLPEFIKDDDTLRNILKVCRSNFRNRLTISLESPCKSFSEWKFSEVCHKYGLSFSPDPDLEGLLPEFDEIEAAPLDSERMEAFQSLAREVEARTQTLHLIETKGPAYDIDGDETQSVKSYGIVTDAKEWWSLECTVDADEQVSFKMSELCDDLNFSSNWKGNAKAVFQKLIWQFSRMQEQIPVHDRRSKTNPNKRGKTVASSAFASSASALGDPALGAQL
ncbi:hypothetical protein BGX27_000985 [Mortierella sp. AM989]|nr:hypothetical protein BGX27_000985 [Mortierella sp. AM989]